MGINYLERDSAKRLAFRILKRPAAQRQNYHVTYNSARRMIVHGYYSSIILSFLFGFTFQSLFFPQLQGLRVIHKSICRRMCFICPTFAYYNSPSTYILRFAYVKSARTPLVPSSLIDIRVKLRALIYLLNIYPHLTLIREVFTVVLLSSRLERTISNRWTSACAHQRRLYMMTFTRKRLILL